MPDRRLAQKKIIRLRQTYVARNSATRKAILMLLPENHQKKIKKGKEQCGEEG